MGKASPSQAKNTIRRSLFELLDPEPSSQEKTRLWTYFDSRCAYCGLEVNRNARTGQADHLVPSSQGGRNHISNRVLSCGTCNGDEKRDRQWEPFLEGKCATPEIFKARLARIREWQAQFPEDDLRLLPKEIVAVIEAASASACSAYESAVDEVRALEGTPTWIAFKKSLP